MSHESKRVAYDGVQIYQTLRPLTCFFCEASVGKGEYFTRSGGGRGAGMSRTQFVKCQRCARFSTPTAESMAEYAESVRRERVICKRATEIFEQMALHGEIDIIKAQTQARDEYMRERARQQ